MSTNPNQTPQPSFVDRTAEFMRSRGEDIALAARVGSLALGAMVATRQMRRAGDTMAKMEHKDSLYADLDQIALTGMRRVSAATMAERTANGQRQINLGEFAAAMTPTGEPARPKGFFEKRRARLSDKRAMKARVQQTYMARDQEIFRGSAGRPTRAQKIDRLKDIEKGARKGTLLPSEVREQYTALLAEKRNHGEQAMKYRNKQVRKTNRKLDRQLDSPAKARRRETKRTKAIGKIQTQHVNHEQRIDHARNIIAAQNNPNSRYHQVLAAVINNAENRHSS